MCSDLLGDHSAVALTKINFKNLSEQFGFRGSQDYYDASVEDFEVVWIQIKGGEMAKCVHFSENLTMTRSTDSLTAKHRKTPQEMWATDGRFRDPVRLFEVFLGRRPSEFLTSEPLYLTLIQRQHSDHQTCQRMLAR